MRGARNRCIRSQVLSAVHNIISTIQTSIVTKTVFGLYPRYILTTMQLEYYYLVFEEDAEQCPKALWESILKRLSVVFSVYGFSKASSDIHELHAICEDNKRLMLYEALPGNVKIKLRQKRKDITDLKSFTKFLMPVLLREEGLCIKDNTKALFDIDDDD